MRLLFVFLLFFIGSLFAQDTLLIPEIELDKKERSKMEFAGVFKSSINVELGGKTGFGGLSYDLLLSRRIRLGLGIGYPAAGVEIMCFPFGVKRDQLLFKLGGRATAFFPPNETGFMLYSVPVGFSYFMARRINLEVDAGPLFKTTFTGAAPVAGLANSLNYVWFSVKLGYRFSFYSMRRARQLNEGE